MKLLIYVFTTICHNIYSTMNGWGFSRNAYDMNDAKCAKTRGNTPHTLNRGAELCSTSQQPAFLGNPHRYQGSHGMASSIMDSSSQSIPPDNGVPEIPIIDDQEPLIDVVRKLYK